MTNPKPAAHLHVPAQSRADAPARGDLLGRADEARDGGRFLAASELYEQVIALGGAQVPLLLMCGHMHKEARNYPAALTRYMDAYVLAPNDAEVLLQLGHFSKTVGNLPDAAFYYERSTLARPGWDEPGRELRLVQEQMEAARAEEREARMLASRRRADRVSADEADGHGLTDESLVPKALEELYVSHEPAFVFTRNGLDQRTRWGSGLTLRGIDALRGYLVSAVPYLTLDIFLDGELIQKLPLLPAPQRRERTNPDLRKYVYNAWIDFTHVPYGRHELVFRATNLRGDMREGIDWRREDVIVAEPYEPGYFGDSDGIIPALDPASTRSVVEQINARPSIVHRVTPRSFPGDVKNVAVIRADQLGDLVVSVPALLRIRELLPNARITGLLSRANEGLARSLGVFDDIVLLDFPDDHERHERVMTRAAQERLVEQLAPYAFDLAIDLPVSGVSHKLLPLTGARVTMGYGGDTSKTFDLHLATHDPKSDNDVMRHSARTRGMAEMLALWLDSGARVVRRDDLSRDMLVQYGLGEGERYVVLHSGARIKFTQWPHYAELARIIVEKLDLRVVYMADTEAQRAGLPAAMLADGRIVYMSQTLPFDHFDAMLSFCTVFVGNDSGPKHLAGLRGANVVSIHSSRIGWNEWGQEQTGVVISRQVPCAGCSLHHEPEECAQAVACITRITVDEVFREVAALV